jgi:ubiquinone/menaquinone biosynthesis C-methylase UbiE
MVETLYIGGATGYDEMFARVTQAGPSTPRGGADRTRTTHPRRCDRHGCCGKSSGAGGRSAGQIVAGDISATMLDVAQRNPQNATIKFEQFDGRGLRFADAHFDRVICQLGLAFFDDPGRGLGEFRRVLQPKGRAAVVVNSTPERSLFSRIGTVIGARRAAQSLCFDPYLRAIAPAILERGP